ncbi:hypothetical protein GQ55_8G170300 [Panicum hallii var. hallii]|uniref:Uncharacterized protein n=1 Tax=Panicum hallii var. hallii TaxID=1504633 RepID=A0A2T7CNH4_9POAL|nr:hypothetical protein GQ55_8G170300 [Panicum hallii var. hallii]
MHTGGGGVGSRMLPPKQLLTIIIVIFSTLSFIKLLLLTSSSSGASSPRSPAWDAGGGGNGTARSALAAKELALLRSLVTARAPCRLLVFGLSPQLLALARLNSGADAGSGAAAATAFVTDSAEDADAARRVLGGGGAARAGSVAVHRARYRDAAAEAWPLLRRARGSPACRRPTGTVRKSGCPLALTSLPREVLDARWDVVVVDGPSGAAPGEPGRMGTIYTAAALARTSAAAAGGDDMVDVAVHDVDRTVERWYAWEYLCEDNLVAAKGRLWHFRVGASSPPDAFCNTGPVQIL